MLKATSAVFPSVWSYRPIPTISPPIVTTKATRQAVVDMGEPVEVRSDSRGIGAKNRR